MLDSTISIRFMLCDEGREDKGPAASSPARTGQNAPVEAPHEVSSYKDDNGGKKNGN